MKTMLPNLIEKFIVKKLLATIIFTIAYATTTLCSLQEHIDPLTVAMIESIIDQIAVPATIADYARDKNWDKVKELAIKPGTNLDVKDNIGNTALTHAIEAGNLEIAQLLVDNGACTSEFAIGRNSTMLMTAIWSNNLRAAQCLCSLTDSHGDRIIILNATDWDEKTALDIAKHCERTEIAHYLQSIPPSKKEIMYNAEKRAKMISKYLRGAAAATVMAATATGAIYLTSKVFIALKNITVPKVMEKIFILGTLGFISGAAYKSLKERYYNA